ncbi:MAG: TonB-dependent receptor [Pseudomonadales bacterium]
MARFTPNRARHPLASAVSLALASTLMSGSVLAQTEEEGETEERKGGMIEEVLVTATKRSVNMQDVAQSIQTMSGEELTRSGMLNFQEFQAAIPSLSSVSTSPGRNEMVFRGISTGSQEWRTDSSVAVYMDEVPMTSAAQQVDPRMVDMARIEALPGPQGTLFGSSSQSGAMKYVTNKPDASEMSGYIRGSWSTMNEGEDSTDVEAMVNLPIIDDVLALRVVGYDVNEGGYIDNVAGTDLFTGATNDSAVEDDFNDWKQSGVRATARWNISDNWNLDMMYIDQTSETTGDWKQDPALDDFEIVRFHKDVRTDDWWLGSLTLQGDIGDFAQLTYAAATVEREVDYEFDTMVSDQLRTRAYGIDNINYAYNPLYYHTAYDIGTVVNDQEGTRTSHEIRLASIGDSRFQWMVGAYYEDTYDAWDWYWVTPNLTSTPAWQALNYLAYWLQNNYNTGTIYPVAPTDRYYGEEFERTTKQTAVFGTFGYDITDAWNVEAGVRWFEYDRQRTEKQYWPYGVPFGNYDNGGVDEYAGKNSDTVYKFSTSYNISDDVMVYALYSEGFRLGGHNTVRNASSLPKEYGPDSLVNQEIGFKGQFFDDALQLNATYYQMDWTEMQREVGDPTALGAKGHVNLGDATSKGIEMSFTGWLSESFMLQGTYFNGSSEIEETVYFSDVVPNLPGWADYELAAAGQPLAIAPDEKWWIKAEYTFHNAMLGADLWFSYDHSWQAAYAHDWWNAQNTVSGWGGNTIPDYQKANFQMGLWAADDWDVTFSIYNVWDDRSVNWVHTGDDWLLDQYNISNYRSLESVIRPREFSIGFSKHF